MVHDFSSLVNTGDSAPVPAHLTAQTLTSPFPSPLTQRPSEAIRVVRAGITSSGIHYLRVAIAAMQ